MLCSIVLLIIIDLQLKIHTVLQAIAWYLIKYYNCNNILKLDFCSFLFTTFPLQFCFNDLRIKSLNQHCNVFETHFAGWPAGSSWVHLKGRWFQEKNEWVRRGMVRNAFLVIVSMHQQQEVKPRNAIWNSLCSLWAGTRYSEECHS